MNERRRPPVRREDPWSNSVYVPEKRYGEKKKRGSKFLSAVILTVLVGTTGAWAVVAEKHGVFKDAGKKITTLLHQDDHAENLENSAKNHNEDTQAPWPNTTITENKDGTTSVSSVGGEYTAPESYQDPIHTAEPTEVAPQLESWYLSGGSLRITPDQIPIDLRLQTGETITFDPQQMAEARQKAIASQEPVLISIYPIPDGHVFGVEPSTPESSVEHPVYDELPTDFITSPEELAQHGVEITQGVDEKLFVRRSAFDPDTGMLGYLEKAGRKLRIVLVEGPYVSSVFLQAPQYDDVRDLVSSQIDNSVSEYRKSKISEYQQELYHLRFQLSQLRRGETISEDIDIEFAEKLIEEYQSYIFSLQTGLVTDAELFFEVNQSEYAGLYYPGWDEGVATLFVAVGNEKIPNNKQEYIYIGYDSTGTVKAYTYGTSSMRPDMRLSAADSQVDPAIFHRKDVTDPHGSSYSYGAQSVGQALQHELKHDALIREGWWPIYAADGRTIIGLEKKPIGDSGLSSPNYSEYDTDLIAMRALVQAWSVWKDSNFTDDSGYQFAFKLTKGGFILTRNDGHQSPQRNQMVSNVQTFRPDQRQWRKQSEV